MLEFETLAAKNVHGLWLSPLTLKGFTHLPRPVDTQTLFPETRLSALHPVFAEPALLTKTPSDWAGFALQDFDAFVIDHAACERKASAVGMSFVVRYPDRPQLVGPMIQFAREELEHFHQVYRILQSRGLALGKDEQDAYVGLLLQHVRTGRDERLLDRLLVNALIEARGCERLALVADALTDDKLQQFYSRLARAEGHHYTLFLELAQEIFAETDFSGRWSELRQIEANAIAAVAYRHALH